MGDVIGSEKILSLPLNGRSYLREERASIKTILATSVRVYLLATHIWLKLVDFLLEFFDAAGLGAKLFQPLDDDGNIDQPFNLGFRMCLDRYM